LEFARAALEHAGWAVAGGFLAPSSDEYLEGKLRGKILSFSRRIELCGFATQESDWLSVCPRGEFSSYRACVRLCEQLERELLNGRSVAGIEVMGSDTAIRILDGVFEKWSATEVDRGQPWYERRIVCCLVRPGPESSAEMEHIIRITAPRAADVGIQIILVDTTSEVAPLETISSTAIRELVATDDWDALRALRWLHPRVLSSLETWRNE
jgi:hypothetical protein